MTEQRDLAGALRWLSALMADLGLPYQVVGGVAALAHGAARPVVDIDLYVPDETALDRVAEAAGPHLVRAPEHHNDEHWDLTFLAMERSGFRIEAAAATGAQVWDGRATSWTPVGVRFDRGERLEVAGVVLPVMPREQLVDYKEGLGREVDHLDLEGMRRSATGATESA